MAASNVAMSKSILSSFSSSKKLDSIPGSLQQDMAVELAGTIKVHRNRTSRGQRIHVAGVRNIASELVEMEPASQDSQLLGEILHLIISIELF